MEIKLGLKPLLPTWMPECNPSHKPRVVRIFIPSVVNLEMCASCAEDLAEFLLGNTTRDPVEVQHESEYRG